MLGKLDTVQICGVDEMKQSCVADTDSLTSYGRKSCDYIYKTTTNYRTTSVGWNSGKTGLHKTLELKCNANCIRPVLQVRRIFTKKYLYVIEQISTEMEPQIT